MVDHDVNTDKYEAYAELFAPRWSDEGVQRSRRKVNYVPKRTRGEILAALTDDLTDVELSFSTTYRPSRHEEGWLLASLHSFYDQGLISDVLALVKGGKEASVYCCEAHPATGLGLLAAKVYRPRMFRSLRNDRMYRQGREVLTPNGRPAGMQAQRVAHAILSKTAFGLQAAHTSWLMHEFTTLERLWEAGASVPRPIAASENAILMSYHGDEQMAAPTLNTVGLSLDEVEPLFQEMLRNIDLMLQHDLVHGDLSAYNILYWQGELTLIDFPQVVNLRANDNARFIFQRDIQRTCEYFALQGAACEPGPIADELWTRYVGAIDADDLAADWSRLERALSDAEDEAQADLLGTV
jgi:RIO kinase 1